MDTNSKQPDRLLTADQVAQHLQISRRALYEMRYQGGGPPAIKVGRRLRFRRREVEAWIDEHRNH